MRSPLIYLIVLVLLIISCNEKKESKNLEQAFVQSFKDGDFKSLEPYFPTREVYRSLETSETKKTDAEIDSFLTKSNQRLREGWDKIAATVKSKNIDPAKITIKEKILFNVFDRNSAQAMVVQYDYNGRTWDDISFIVKEKDKKTYLLEITNPTDVFSFEDTTLINSAHAKATLELQRPDFRQSVQDQVKQLINWANEDNLKDFSTLVVYQGNDEKRSWRSAVNMADPDESKMAGGKLEQVKNIMKNCGEYTFGNIQGQQESEGFWIVQPVTCGKGIVHFAFLKVNDKLLFGDIETMFEIRK